MDKSLQQAGPTTTALPKLATLPVEARTLATAVLLVLALGMLGALGQIIIHDIIPTVIDQEPAVHNGQATGVDTEKGSAKSRGDLFGDPDVNPVPASSRTKPLHQQEQFVWLLKWTHIHLFGMSMIFIFVGGITVLLDLKSGAKTWLVTLPFIGVWIDISAMWLKAYISPLFFWLHLPGGAMFSGIFAFVLIRALVEMWGTKRISHGN